MKKILIGGGVGVIIILGLGYGVIQAQPNHGSLATIDAPLQAKNQATEVPAVSDRITGNNSLQNLVRLGKTLKCSFTTSDVKTTAEGIAYFNNGNMRVDTSYKGADNIAKTSSLILNIDGDTMGAMMYTWAKTNTGVFAVKMPTASISDIETQMATQYEGEVSLQNKVQYDCAPWGVDESLFVPPTDVAFMDMSDITKNLPKIPAGMMGDQPVSN